MISFYFLSFLLLISSAARGAELGVDRQAYPKDGLIKINYANVPASKNNWIGIWRYKDGSGSSGRDLQDGPWNQTQTNKADAWQYVTQENGQITVNARNLQPGRYAAFLLKEGGYTWLSNPTLFDIADDAGNVDLKTLMFNIWLEGTKVSGGFDGIVNEISATNADIVALSEVSNYGGVDFTQRLVGALSKKGFKYYSYKASKDTGIISRFPIKSHTDFDRFTKSVIDVNGVNLAFYSGHLDYKNYAAYLPRGYDGNSSAKLPKPETTVDNILKANDSSARPASIRAFISDAKREIESGSAIIMAGDFNEPSWLDWIYENRTSFDHNGVVIAWTSTKLLSEAGFQDAYRAKYPSPILNPGFTWVSDNPAKKVNELTWAPTADERDRIDYVFYYPDGRLSVRDAIIVGPSRSIVKSQRVGESASDVFKEPEGVWPSDHKAVLITFGIGSAGK